MKSLTASTRQQVPYGEQPAGHRSLAKHRGAWWMSYLALTAIFVACAFPCGAQAGTVTLPKTGQNLCYDATGGVVPCAGTGQDGETQAGAAWPTPRFTDNRNGTVTDNLSGLSWLKDASCIDLQPAAGKDWFGATATVQTLQSGLCQLSDGSLAGDWRLPNVNELESLVDLSRNYPPLPDGHPFINVAQGWYWSSTVQAVYPNNADGVDMGIGNVRGDVRDQLKMVWPVKGVALDIAKSGQSSCWDMNGLTISCAGTGADGEHQAGVQWPSPRFVDNGNGTVTDELTGLVWLKEADCYGVTSTQGAALTLAGALAGGTCKLGDGSLPGNWRLPNRKEMRSLVNYQQADGASSLNAQGFANLRDGWYWTSDSSVISSDKWQVKLEGGAILSGEVVKLAQPSYLLPVRGPLPAAITLQYFAGAGGTISGAATQTVSPGGSGSTVTAIAGTGYRFVSWSDGMTSAARTDTNVQANLSVTASFAVNTNSYTLLYSATPSGAGTVTAKPSQTSYPSGTQVVLTATPTTGYTFSGWSGDASGTANPLTVAITGNTSITANFAALPGSLTVTPATALSAAGAPGGPFTPSSATYTLQNSGNAPITWNASKTQQWVTLSLSGGGSLAPGGTATVTVSLNATAATLAAGNYSDSVIFTNATNGSGTTTRTVNLTVAAAQSSNIASLATVTASTQNTSTGQTAVKAVDGVIDGYPGDYTKEWATTGQKTGAWLNLSWSAPYSVNQVVLYDRPNLNDQITTATIAFSDGSSISVGPLNNNGTATTYSFPARVITGLKMTVTGVSSSTGSVGLSEIQVYGTPASGIQYTLTTSVSPSGGGSVTANPSQTGYPSGAQVVLTATPTTGYTFSGWSGGASGTVNPLTVTMAGNLAITANFSAGTQPTNIAPQSTVTASSQNTTTGQTAVKAVDGVIDGYPGDYTKEWATTGQKTGAWLNLSWPTSHSVTQVVLYDRPNLNDQITAATITFSDGSSIVVGPLNNDGTATTYSFPAKVITGLKMTVTGVSSSTGSVGLSEIQVYGR